MPLTDLLAQTAPFDSRQFIDSLARTPLSRVVLFVAVLTAIRLLVSPVLAKTPAHKRTLGYGVLSRVNELCDALVYAAVFVFLVIRPFVVQAFLIPSGSMWPTLHVNDFIVANKAIYRFTEPKTGDIVVFRPPTQAVRPEEVGPDGQVKIDYIKRLIGVPGDLIELREGVLYRNGKREEEPYRVFSECSNQPSPFVECQDFRQFSKEEVAQITPQNWKLVKRSDGSLMPLNWTKFDVNATSPQSGSFTVNSRPYAVAQEYAINDPAEGERLKALPAQKIPPGYFLMMGDNRNGSFDGRAWGLVPRDSIVGRSEAIWLPLPRWGITR